MVTTTASFKELIAIADDIAEGCIEMGRDSSRLVAGWHRVDKDIMKQCVQSFYHMGWNIKDLRDNMNEVTGLMPAVGPMELSDIRYQDHDTLTSAMLKGRTKNWYHSVKTAHQDMRRILAVMESVEARPWRVSFIMARIYLDLHFFKDQYEQATGEKLED